MTHAEGLQRAHEDYARAKGTVITVDWLYGYRGDHLIDLYCDPPMAVRVLDTPHHDLHHQVDDWLDPYWDVEPVDPTATDLRSCWVFGPSYRVGADAGGSV